MRPGVPSLSFSKSLDGPCKWPESDRPPDSEVTPSASAPLVSSDPSDPITLDPGVCPSEALGSCGGRGPRWGGRESDVPKAGASPRARLPRGAGRGFSVGTALSASLTALCLRASSKMPFSVSLSNSDDNVQDVSRAKESVAEGSVSAAVNVPNPTVVTLLTSRALRAWAASCGFGFSSHVPPPFLFPDELKPSRDAGVSASETDSEFLCWTSCISLSLESVHSPKQVSLKKNQLCSLVKDQFNQLNITIS